MSSVRKEASSDARNDSDCDTAFLEILNRTPSASDERHHTAEGPSLSLPHGADVSAQTEHEKSDVDIGTF